jgi:transcriptional regulator with XRE-family HTH domain
LQRCRERATRNVVTRQPGTSKVAIKLNALRARKKWTYDQLAAHLNRSRSRVHEWCTDQRDPSTANVRHIAHVLKCPLSDLI